MDPLLLSSLLLLVVVAVVAVGLGLRRRRDAALEPTRLGPSWTPTFGEDVDVPVEVTDLGPRAAEVAERTGIERDTVLTVLEVWREYLAVLGLTRLPATHRYRVYDPYNPPVASRGADGQPLPDRTRVARDVGNRTAVSERDADLVLAADAELVDGSDPRR